MADGTDDSTADGARESEAVDTSPESTTSSTAASEPVSESRHAPAGSWFGLAPRAKPLVKAGVVLGIGLGGFFDGIVLHQLLQVHHMVSSRVAPTDLAGMEVNVVADGIFHAGTYLFTVAGIVLLYRAWRRPAVPASGRAILGAALMGFGLFNLVEGIVNHHLLVLHRVWPAGPGPAVAWDVLFLLSGVLLLLGGYAIVRSDSAVTAGR